MSAEPRPVRAAVQPHEAAPLDRIAVRRLRLGTGMVLFAYVGTHLVDHALGNISIGAMQADLAVQRVLWQGPVGTVALYGALLIHYALGLRAYYERRDFGWTAGELTQTVLGLSIPFLLVSHLFATRVALAQFGILKGYPQELHSFFVARPDLGLVQLALLLVAWIHGCLGLHFWLRLKPGFPRWSTALLCAAILVPTLALLGAVQGGRRVLALSGDPTWRHAQLAPAFAGTPPEDAVLDRERDLVLLLLFALLAGTTAARGVRFWRERGGGGRTVAITYPGGLRARVPLGFSILEASRAAGIPHVSLCGGRARCSTCRVTLVSGQAPPPTAGEQAVLDRVRAGPDVRLACQLRPLTDAEVRLLLPPSYGLDDLRRRRQPRPGQERFVVVLVADLRGSMALAETRLPFDAVFLIGRFVAAISEAVVEAGGQPNQFTGDGLLAIFGLDAAAGYACAQSLRAAAGIGRRVAAMNAALAADGVPPIRFGLGIHGGSAVVGEIMLGPTPVFTTLGEVASVATRLEELAKQEGCEAVVSDLVLRGAGVTSPQASRPFDAVLRGRSDPLPVHLMASAANLPNSDTMIPQPSRSRSRSGSG